MINALYILTDADGFTTCCDADPVCLEREISRIPLAAPIQAIHWYVGKQEGRSKLGPVWPTWIKGKEWTAYGH